MVLTKTKVFLGFFFFFLGLSQTMFFLYFLTLSSVVFVLICHSNMRRPPEQ